MKANSNWSKLGWRHSLWNIIRFYLSIRGTKQQETWRNELRYNKTIQIGDGHTLPVPQALIELLFKYLDVREEMFNNAFGHLRDENEALQFCADKKLNVGKTTTKNKDHHQASKAMIATVSGLAGRVCFKHGVSLDDDPQKRCIWCKDKELQARNLNYWVQQEIEKRDNLFCRFDGSKLRAVFTDRYKAIDHMDILSKMLEYGFKEDIEVHYSLDQNLLVLKVPDFTRTFGFDGDNIVPGISIANSEVGILAFSIEAYFYRLVCSNGMISKTSVASRFKHVSRRALEEFSAVIGHVVNESEHNQRKFKISTQSHVGNPLVTIGSFNTQFQVTKKEAETIQYAWEFEQGYTMFHVINAYTRAAQDSRLTSEESYKLEKVGGLILSLVKQ